MTDKPEESEEIDLEGHEEEKVQEREPLRAPVIYEIVRRDGEEELARPAFSLLVSGFVAGLAIGFSVVGEAVLHAYLPDAPWRHLVESLGYSVGFLIVIMARLQLFTENTITPVLPTLLNPTAQAILHTARLWAIVLAANVAGCFVFALAIHTPGSLPVEVYSAAISISQHIMENSWWQMFVRAIFSGFLIAALVWMMPTAQAAKFWAILLVTYVIAAASFTHIVASSVEAFLLMLAGDLTIPGALWDFFAPVLLGNVLGGTFLFAMLSYGQVSQEV